MSFTIEVTEVGEAEIPLIGVLHQTIHGSAIESQLRALFARERDVLLLLAHLEGNPLGYAIGYGLAEGVFVFWRGGVLREYLPEGVPRLLRDRLTMWANARGYQQIRDDSA